MDSEYKDIEKLLQRYMQNECTREEFERLMEWIRNQGNDSVLEDYVDAHFVAWRKAKAFVEEKQIQKQFLQLMQRADNYDSAQTKRWNLYKAAASIIILVAVGIGLARFTPLQDTLEQLSYNSLEVKEARRMMLSDGTDVRMNAGSMLKYPDNFEGKQERRVLLSGEAYFKVARNPGQPFIISTARSRIKVLGTAFNVKELNDTTVLVAVAEGKVSLSFVSDAASELKLTKGMVGILSGKNVTASTVDNVSNYLAWFSNSLEFNNSSLRSILTQLEHIHKVDITVKDSALNDMKLTLKIKNYPVEQVLDEIAMALNLTISKRNGGYEVSY